MLFTKKSAEPVYLLDHFASPIHSKGIGRVTLSVFAIYIVVCLGIVSFVGKTMSDAKKSTIRAAEVRATVISKSYANYLAERTDFANIIAKSVAYQFQLNNKQLDLDQLVKAGLVSPSNQRLVTHRRWERDGVPNMADAIRRCCLLR